MNIDSYSHYREEGKIQGCKQENTMTRKTLVVQLSSLKYHNESMPKQFAIPKHQNKYLLYTPLLLKIYLFNYYNN